MAKTYTDQSVGGDTVSEIRDFAALLEASKQALDACDDLERGESWWKALSQAVRDAEQCKS